MALVFSDIQMGVWKARYVVFMEFFNNDAARSTGRVYGEPTHAINRRIPAEQGVC